MVPSSIVLMLLQLCSLPFMAIPMPTCNLQSNLVTNAHNLLRDLGGSFPVHCLQYNLNITFPESVFPNATSAHPQCHKALWVVYETLRDMQQMFDDYDLPVGKGGVSWDQRKLDDFRNLQYRLISKGSCLSGDDVLSSYFDSVKAIIGQQDSEACGWMALRRDVLSVLKTALKKHKTCFT